MYAIDLYAEVRHAVLVEGISIRAAALRFKLDRKTIRKILQHAAPPGYQRNRAPLRPKLDPVRPALDLMIQEDAQRPVRQRRSAQTLMQALRERHGYGGGLTIIKDYLRKARLTQP
jgi:transposase